MSSNTNYQHPFITIQIYDNTEFVDSAKVEERREFNGMQVGFFAGGRDNKLLYMPNREKYLRECGNPNFKVLGQAAYNVDNALATENCGMYVMNLRPDTATHSNIVIMVKFKADSLPSTEPGGSETELPTTPGDTTGGDTLEPPKGLEGTEEPLDPQAVEETPVSKLRYAFYAKVIEGANTEDELKTAVRELMQTDPDEQGFYHMPFILLYSQGRGEYGNLIHLQFNNVTEYITEEGLFMDYTYPKYHTYSLTVMEPTNDGLVRREISYGTFDIDGFDNTISYGPSLYIEDVINDLENGSQRIGCRIYAETIDAICEVYNRAVVPDGTITPATLDLITGYDLITGMKNKHLEVEENVENSVNLLALDGFTLSGGKDGWEDMTAEEIVVAKSELLVKAYAGDIDPYIKSRFSSPMNFNLDANYDVRVKKQMAALANLRKYDCMTYLDMCCTLTTSGLISMATTLKNVSGFNVIKDGHCYKSRDVLYTGKVCQFTITHWLAKALPNHMKSDDTIWGMPLARDTAILRAGTDYIRGTFFPVIEPDSDDIKETLYKLRVNVYETLTYNSVQRSTAITTCKSKSDRLLEMNEYILQRAIKISYDLLASKIYKLGEESDRAQYEQDASDILSNKLNKYVRSASVEFEMTPEDEKKSLLRLKLRLTFKTVIQQGELVVYLDPRVTDAATTLSVA